MIAVAGAFALALSSTGAAAQPPLVGVAAESPTDPARKRIIQELEAQGYEVRVVDPDERASGLSATLQVRGRAIEVRVTVRRDGALERREATIAVDDPMTATTRAIEFLRASLVEIGVEPAVRESESKRARPPISHDVPNPPAQARMRELGLGVGAAAVHSPGGLAPLAMLVPSLSWRMRAPLRVRLQGMIPITSGQLSGSEGSVSIHPTFLGLSVGLLPLQSVWVEPYVEGGLNAVVFKMQATAADGYASRSSSRLLANAAISAGVLLFPRARVSVAVSGTLGAGLQHEHVYFGDRRVAEWGTWYAGAGAAIEIGLD
jgi:hypothetical protein